MGGGGSKWDSNALGVVKKITGKPLKGWKLLSTSLGVVMVVLHHTLSSMSQEVIQYIKNATSVVVRYLITSKNQMTLVLKNILRVAS